jgi:hypothetical protein
VDTGRRCCLLDGHPGLHRHGRTEFLRVAVDDEEIARARQRLNHAAATRLGTYLENDE